MATYGKRMMMTLVGGFSLLFVIACGTVPTDVTTSPTPLPLKQAVVGINSPGDVVLTGAYCVGVNEAFMKSFTAMLAQYGTPGYWKFIEQKNSPCYDTRLGLPDGQPINPVKAQLLERMWDFQLPSGKRYVMWRAEDEYGHEAFTWTNFKGQPA